MSSPKLDRDRWEIYALAEPDGRVRYIGSTSDAKIRFTQHIRDSRRRRHPVNRWIKSLSNAGQKPKMLILDAGTSKDERGFQEKYWIAHYRLLEPNILNVADGAMPEVPSDARVRAGLKMRGRKLSDLARKRISEGKKRAGTKRPDTAERNRANAHLKRGRKLNLSDEERERRREQGRRSPNVGRRGISLLSPESRKQISIKMTAIWAKRRQEAINGPS